MFVSQKKKKKGYANPFCTFKYLFGLKEITILLLLNYFKFFFIVIITRCQKCEFISDKNIILGKIPT